MNWYSLIGTTLNKLPDPSVRGKEISRFIIHIQISIFSKQHTVHENIIGAPKIRNNF